MPAAPVSQTIYQASTGTNNVENNDVSEQRKPLISDTNTTSNHGDSLKQDSDHGLVKLSTV